MRSSPSSPASFTPGGLFNAYDDISRLDRVDAIVHLGDYIYEHGAEGYGAATGVKLGRVVDPPHEIVTLADYRRRHAQYKTDPDLQAAHARAAFICVWDDHEVANDSWLGGAENHQPETEGEWRTRKNAALQAYFEWMPIRDPQPGKPWESINRGFQFGDLATLLMVETRLLARSHQAVLGDRAATPETSPPCWPSAIASIARCWASRSGAGWSRNSRNRWRAVRRGNCSAIKW
jgi:alkaline phosphatase D